MGFLRRKEHYDRRRILERAARAGRSRRRTKRRRAIALYHRVLEVEPNDPDVLRKLAPLLVRTDREAEGCAAYRQAASVFVSRGYVDRAIGVYRDAVRTAPRDATLWKEMAGLGPV